MAIKNFGFTKTVSPAQMYEIFGNGTPEVVDGIADWKVDPVAGTRAVSIRPGGGQAAFVRTVTDAAVVVPLARPAGNFAQWYLIARRIDWTTGAVSFVALPGPVTDADTIANQDDMSPDDTWPSGFRRDAGILWYHPLAWALAEPASATVHVRDIRRIQGSPKLIHGPNMLLEQFVRGTINSDPSRPLEIAGNDIIVPDLTPVLVTAHFRWSAPGIAAGVTALYHDGVAICTNQRMHNDGVTGIPLHSFQLAKTMLHPGTNRIALWSNTDSGSRGARTFADITVDIFHD
jgi:hypothetical protein